MSEDIKTMKLYHQVERVFNELQVLGISDDDLIPIETLCQFDQYHYFGTDAVDDAISKLGIHSQMSVLEIGSGSGGPSRYLSHATGCMMTALELQSDLDLIASTLTRRCGLEQSVHHVCGDILQGLRGTPKFDAIVSWLTFLHIADRQRLYNQCFELLKPGAGIYVEDYYERGSLNADERKLLRQDVYCDRVPTISEYQDELSKAGFVNIELSDLSDEWTGFVTGRLESFIMNKQRNIKLHGELTVSGLEHFYTTVVTLFQQANLGGIRVIAYKPE